MLPEIILRFKGKLYILVALQNTTASDIL